MTNDILRQVGVYFCVTGVIMSVVGILLAVFEEWSKHNE